LVNTAEGRGAEQPDPEDALIPSLCFVSQNPTDDIIDSKLRAFKLLHKKTLTFGQLAHVW
jgi:hypothetical protein